MEIRLEGVIQALDDIRNEIDGVEDDLSVALEAVEDIAADADGFVWDKSTKCAKAIRSCLERINTL